MAEMRLIDANSLREKIKEVSKDAGFYRPIYEGFLNNIERTPTVDATEVVHGRWEHMHDFAFNCTHCGNISEVKTCMGKPKWSYCPNCGARMDGDVNDI